MKRKLTVILATFVVTLGLLLGTSAAQEPTVIFEEGTNKAIAIRNLEVEGTLYNVKFTPPATAAEVYGEYPGTFDFTNSTPVFNAADAVNRELNLARAKGVGAEGSVAVPFYWIGFASKQEIDPIIEVVFYQPAVYACSTYDDDLCSWGEWTQNSALYNDGTGVWAKFTEASKAAFLPAVYLLLGAGP